MLALYRFCQRHADRRTAQVAALVMGLSLAVGFIAKAAISDALLNLFIALSMFGIYDFFCAERDGRPTRRLLYYTYAMLGLGFLTKGPVAVFFPLVVSGLFFVSAGAGAPGCGLFSSGLAGCSSWPSSCPGTSRSSSTRAMPSSAASISSTTSIAIPTRLKATAASGTTTLRCCPCPDAVHRLAVGHRRQAGPAR
jgi:hypothetical protein